MGASEAGSLSESYRDLVERPCREISCGDLAKRSLTETSEQGSSLEISCRDLVWRSLRDLFQRAGARSPTAILPRDLL
jgi:hypothetical protein